MTTTKSMRLGKNMKHALLFFGRHIDYGWHTYAKNRATVRAIQSLAKLGIMDVSEATQQARLHDNATVNQLIRKYQ